MSKFDDKFKEVDDWFKRYQKSFEMYSQLNKVFKEFSNQKSILDQVPENEIVLKESLENTLFEPISIFAEALGPKLNIDEASINYSGATASSGSAIILDSLQHHSPSDPNLFGTFKNESFRLVKAFQNEQNSIDFIAEKLKYIYLDLGNEFLELVDNFEKFTSNIISASAFAIKMRNVLEHFKGVCNKAAVVKKNGKFVKAGKLTWSQINEFIALEGKGSRYEKDLQKNTSIYSRLHDDLSEDAKDYAASDESLKEMYTILIQYLESCLKLVEIEEIKNAL